MWSKNSKKLALGYSLVKVARCWEEFLCEPHLDATQYCHASVFHLCQFIIQGPLRTRELLSGVKIRAISFFITFCVSAHKLGCNVDQRPPPVKHYHKTSPAPLCVRPQPTWSPSRHPNLKTDCTVLGSDVGV